MDQNRRVVPRKGLLVHAMLSAGAIVSMAGVVLIAYQGGTAAKALIAAVSGVIATAILTYSFTGRFLTFREAIQDFLVTGLLVLSVRSTLRIWQAPASWGEIFTFTDFAAALVIVVYFGLIIFSLATTSGREKPLHAAGVLAAPVLFNLLLLLQSPVLLQQTGSALMFGMKVSPEFFQALGRVIVLTVFNEGVAGLVSILIAGRLVGDGRVHVLLITSAVWCGLTPAIANWGSVAGVASLPFVSRMALVLAATMASQAGLWGQVYLLTGILLDVMHGKKPTWYWGTEHFRNGCVKGAVYSGIFMALVHSSVLLLKNQQVQLFFTHNPLITSLVIGSLLFPLLKTIIESFDVSTPIFGRLATNYQVVTHCLRGAVVGGVLCYALRGGLLIAESLDRFTWGFAIGAVAYGGVDLFRDMIESAKGTREKLQTWKVYALGIFLGGMIGGILAWYFDGPQTSVVAEKLQRYAALFYPASGIEVKDYFTYPLFNKWGAVNLGTVGGGVRLLYSEAVAGVVNWAFAAPLFSINLVLLTALLRRSTAPLRELMSMAGFTGVVEQTVRVLRWGLWMAPIINSFLKMSPDPTWYNQDGAIRSTLATVKTFAVGSDSFRSWSLHVFTNLLVYDWFRVLIWFDHMGLRVATLVNLSFVGGDLVDEKAARALGYSARTRWMPEGVRRFATWAPLLIPFFIPRGNEWDMVWTQYEAASKIQGQTFLPPGAFLIGACILGALTIGLFMLVRNVRCSFRGNSPQYRGEESESSGCPPALFEEKTHVLTNGVYTVELKAGGRGYSRVFSSVRKGEELDLTRPPADPQWLCGKFFYLKDKDLPEENLGSIWSLSYNPVQRAGLDYAATRLSPDSVKISHTYNRIYSEAVLSVAGQDPVEIWQVRLQNLENKPRTLELTSYRELVMNARGSFWRHPIFNNLHVATWFVKPLNAIFARNNLLKNVRRDSTRKKRSRETTFHAVKENADGTVTLIGYEDYRPYFLGQATLRMPEGLRKNLRDPQDEGLLYSFSPAACLRLLIQLPPHGGTEVQFVDGYAADEHQAAQMITRYLGIPNPNGHTFDASFAKRRGLLNHEASGNHDTLRQPHQEKALSPDAGVFSFSEDGTELHMGWKTPRPWAHIMANEKGYGAIAGNDGDIYSFMGNAQQNGLTPFNFGSTLVQTPSQVLYLFNQATGKAETPTYAPLRQKDAQYRITFGRGYVIYKKVRESVDMEYTLAVLPDQPAEVRLLTIRNRGNEMISYRVVPYFQMMLGEEAFDTAGKIIARFDDARQGFFFTNPGNDFHKGWAFIATSLQMEAVETLRKRFIGGPDRRISWPYMVEHGTPDPSQTDGGYRIAGFASTITIPPGGEETIAIVVGQADDFETAGTIIRTLREVPAAREALEKTKRWWSDKLSSMRIETNEPAFDRMVNDWLPYQVYVSHLWGRTGLCQRSGAYGFRDQIQDVLPFMFIDPETCRSQILLHASQQFAEGDVLQWWHQSWEGKTGLGLRGRASDHHLWLPYMVFHYVHATGDHGILDEKVPFLEPRPIPKGANEILFAQRSSRGFASLYEHCLKAIRFSLRKQGSHGLPLIGTGDWNDGLNQVGPRGKGESVWLGFFLYEVLCRFSELMEIKQDTFTKEYFSQKAQNLKQALDRMWRGNHYIRAITDDGRELDVADALTASWPIISHAADFEKGAKAMETGLKELEKDNMILLCSPPFTDDSDPYPGRIADYPPGVRENGGQYSHGASWIVDALVCLADLAEERGKANQAATYRAKAVEVWLKISPLMHMNNRSYGLSPHQQAADIYFGPGYEGRGGWSWYTGSAGRMLYTAYTILGLKMEHGNLTIAKNAFEPKGSLGLKRVVYRGKTYEQGSS
jgi:cyclic beta-1,2-glucan synthetase